VGDSAPEDATPAKGRTGATLGSALEAAREALEPPSAKDAAFASVPPPLSPLGPFPLPAYPAFIVDALAPVATLWTRVGMSVAVRWPQALSKFLARGTFSQLLAEAADVQELLAWPEGASALPDAVLSRLEARLQDAAAAAAAALPVKEQEGVSQTAAGTRGETGKRDSLGHVMAGGRAPSKDAAGGGAVGAELGTQLRAEGAASLLAVNRLAALEQGAGREGCEKEVLDCATGDDARSSPGAQPAEARHPGPAMSDSGCKVRRASAVLY
jgi:hypothetical protein